MSDIKLFRIGTGTVDELTGPFYTFKAVAMRRARTAT
jgi:hypothetical protein